MKPECFLKLCMIILVSLSLGACHTTIEPFEIKTATVLSHRTTDGSVINNPTPISLNKQKILFIQNWLTNHREGWSSHNPMATLLPQWCISLQTTNDLSLGLCHYGKNVVLRGLGPEIEHPLSESDISAFSKNI
jgi:hypothetical protein